ncbi:MAG TPA: hypothetical protein VLA19_08505, partial [Herpetosiphonaceae bacterium]|nr:hypothetical protein [Herpetosiphonaceae bacterium]
MLGIHDKQLELLGCLKHVIHSSPVNAGGFHGGMGTAGGRQPIGKTQEVGGESTEGAHLLVGFAIGAESNEAGDNSSFVDIEAAGAFNHTIHRTPPEGRWTSNMGVRVQQTFCCVLPREGATDGGAFRRPGSAFLRAHGTKLLDLCLLPSSMVQYRHFHLMVVTAPVMTLF